MDIKIVDNFLSKEDFHNLNQIIKNANEHGFWKFNENIAYEEEINLNNSSYFTHAIYNYNVPVTTHRNLMEFIFKSFLPELIDFNSLMRVKANLFTWTEKLQEFALHTDCGDLKCKGAIFYLNTCDGYTHFEDGTKVESVENRMLFFDASIPHGSTNTTDAKCRMNINFNYL